MKKRGLTAFLIVLSLSLTLIPVPSFAEDAPSDWASSAVEEAQAAGISCTVDFTAPLSREDFCKYACELLLGMELITLQTPTETFSNPFGDTDSRYVFTLFSEGIIEGKTPSEFCPDDILTRAEAATILGRMVRFADVRETGASVAYTYVRRRGDEAFPGDQQNQSEKLPHEIRGNE